MNLARSLFLLLVLLLNANVLGQPGYGWPTYGGNPGGQRFSNADQVKPENVKRLRVAWTYHTHALESTNLSVSRSDFEATPIFFHDTLYLATPFDRVIALDAATGAERWVADPHLADNILAANYTSRGVAAWQGSQDDGGVCQSRIFLATLDARLIAMDAVSGARCQGFGASGQVDLKAGVPTNPLAPYRFFGNTSPPTVIGNVVVVGSAVPDNQAVDVEPGYVRGFDAVTGRLLWTWDAMPWARAQKVRTGGGNAWGVIAADLKNGLIYVPTGSPAPDFYGGLRLGNDADANSLVAIEATTGRKVWSFQLIHHDIWDYDVASEPLLFEFRGKIPAVAIASKIGIVFLFNRLTGEPLYPIEERAVPQSDVAGEEASPTQPFTRLPPLTRQTYNPEDLAGNSPADTAGCLAKLRRLRYQGVFTPPSLAGTLQFPGSLGGVNWGSMAFDPGSGTLFANTNGSAYEIRLLPQLTAIAKDALRMNGHRRLGVAVVLGLLLVAGLVRRTIPTTAAALAACVLISAMIYGWTLEGRTAGANRKFINSPDAVGEVSPQAGVPFRIYRKVVQDDEGRPCTMPPWGKTIALNLNTGTVSWERPLGDLERSHQTGSVGFGAPVLTRGGLLFTAASQDPYLFALDSSSGKELWKGLLPVPAQSTPMTYEIRKRQFIVVDAGGHGGLGTPLGDSVVAFSLDGEIGSEPKAELRGTLRSGD